MRKTLIIAAALLAACSQGGNPGGSPSDGPKEAWTVKAKETPSSEWKEYQAWTVDRLPGFKPGAAPQTDRYGGWKTV